MDARSKQSRKPSGWTPSNNHEGNYGAGWKKTRLRILERDRYLCKCEDCALTGRLRPATEVDHKIRISAGGTGEDSNLQAINSECHKIKTIREEGRRPKYGVSIDGLPLDPRHPWNLSKRK